MRRFRKKFKRKRSGNILSNSQGYRSSSHMAISVSDMSRLRSRRRKRGIKAFIKNNSKIIALAAGVVVIAAVCIILFTGGKAATMAQSNSFAPEVSLEPTVPIGEFNEEQEYAYKGVDQSVLAGLAGTDESLFTDEQTEVQTEPGIKIGITIGNIQTDIDEMLLSKLQEVSGIAEEQGDAKVYFYDAGGDYNQQLQNVRSLIKNKADVIIVGASSEECFNMVSFMAAEEGIPIVTYNAPSKGYAVNVVTNHKEWGRKYGQFMAEKLPEGNIVQILGSEDSLIDKERKCEIDSALSGNPNIVTVGTSYASWNKDAANESMDAFIAQNGQIDGVITEEGMAYGVITAWIEKGLLPKVMCGDATAGFIKTWYALKNEGVAIPSQTGEQQVSQQEKAQDNQPTAVPVIKAPPGEFVVCAQPAPSSVSAVAFKIALKLAEGRTLKSGDGVTYDYMVSTFITNDNLAEYYELVKDQPDTYVVGDTITDEALEILFNPSKESGLS
ncbi:MAG: substrate-binding domain-containing protein [Christensenellales bacterium]|jgi:ribose transport system substrate-binding protein